MEGGGWRMKELITTTKFVLPEGYPFGGSYLVNKRMEDEGSILQD
jgi:hypothetical protein